MTITVIVLIATAALFVWGKIRSDMVAMCSLLALVLTKVLTPQEALAGFSNPIVIMIAGLFIVGGAIFQTGLASSVSTGLLKLAGDNTLKLFILLMLVTSFIGSFLSNTGTVALLMPIVVSMATKSNINVRRLLMPMAYASSIGGMMTLIGTPPILIMHNQLVEAGYSGFGFFTTLPVGLTLLVAGILLLWPLTKALNNKKNITDGQTTVKSPEQLAVDYHLTENLYRVKIGKHTPIIGIPLSKLDITKKYGVVITEIRKKNHNPLVKSISQRLPDANTVLTEEDSIFLIGNFENIHRFVTENKLRYVDERHEEGMHKPAFSGKLKFDEIGMAEVVLLSNSRLNGTVVKDSGFRQNYNVNIMGIQRQNQHILHNVKDEKMQSGDMLLVQGSWEDIDRLSRMESEIVVIGQPTAEASKITLDHKAPVAGIIMVLMVLAMVLNLVPPVIAVLTAAVAMIITGCFRTVKDAYKNINWESVILFAAMIPLATAMEKTGASAVVTNSIVDTLGSYGPYAILAGLLLATSTLTMFISNTATAVLFAPIALQAAETSGVNPYPFLIGVAVAASMCLASPFSTPPNAMVMSAGRYTFMDYVKVGLPLQLIYIALMVVVLPVFFPF